MKLFSILNKAFKQHSRRSMDVIGYIAFLIAVTVRLFKLMMEPLLLRDSALYLKSAEIWNETGEYSEIIKVPPLPLWCIKTLMSFCGDAELSGRTLSIILGGIICVTGFYLAKEIYNNIWISIFAAACLIFHPKLVFYSTQPLRENYFILLTEWVLIVMVNNFRTPKLSGWFICGAFIGTAIFCRLESLEFIVIIIAEIVFLYLNNKNKVLFFSSVFFLFFGLILFLYLLLLLCAHGDYSFMHKGPSISWSYLLMDS